MKHLVLLLMVLLAQTGHAKETSFIRDYTYKASDLDSKVSARNNTLKLIRACVLEEIVTYVYNNSSLKQTQAGKTSICDITDHCFTIDSCSCS